MPGSSLAAVEDLVWLKMYVSIYIYIYGCIHIYVCICLAQVILWFKALFGSRCVYIYIKCVSNHWSISSQTKMHVAQVLLLAQGIAFFQLCMCVCIHIYIYMSVCGSSHCVARSRHEVKELVGSNLDVSNLDCCESSFDSQLLN